MSRCFPFPPPGYEKKARTDDVDLLKKEKHKEKKHKKEKKDKEKKESKEKREKDRGDGKHREKKDKKDKQRDKKKEKDREKDKYKDKNNKVDEKRIPMQSEAYNGDKVSDEKRFPGKHEGQTVEKFIQKEKEKDKDRSGMSGEKKYTGQYSGYNGERLSQNNHLAEESKDNRFVQELERRVRDEGAGSQSIDNLSITDRRRNEGMVKLVPRTAGTSMGTKEKTKDKAVDDRKLEGQGIRAEARVIGNSAAQNLFGNAQPKVEGIARKSEKDVQKMVERKEKIKEKEGDSRGDKHGKQKKKSHGKDKDRDIEKKKNDKSKERFEQKNGELGKVRENKDDIVGGHNINNFLLPKEGNKSAVANENSKKRKDIETNGFLHANNVKPNKLPKLPSHPFPENGRLLEFGQASSLSTSDRVGIVNNVKVDSKERKVNGMIEGQPLPVSSLKPPPASTARAEGQPLLKPPATLTSPAVQNAQVPKKPPHPDLKYLSEILTVPKMEEWSDFDDQEWLFHKGESEPRKPRLGYSEVDEAPKVWAESMQIDSVDIVALPYVIPY